MKSLIQKIKDTLGIHTLEFSMIMILIMAGILIGGPYVIRSWNANMKGWEDSVMDSFNDPLIQGPYTGRVPDFCECPGPWDDFGCDEVTEVYGGGTLDCLATHMLIKKRCNFLDCDLESDEGLTRDCEERSECCTDWFPSADPLDGEVNPSIHCGVNASPPCPDGEVRQTQTCGVTGFDTQCVPSPDCVFECGAGTSLPTGPSYAGLCSGDDAGLSDDTPYTTVNFGGCSPPPGSVPKCQVECSSCDYLAWGSACVNPPPNTVLQEGCPLGEYRADGCPFGQIRTCRGC